MTPGLTAQHLFGTPLVVADLEDWEIIGRDLRVRIEERCRPGAQDLASGWRSDDRMMRWGGDAAVGLLEQAIQLADRLTMDIDAPDGSSRYLWFAQLGAELARGDGTIESRDYPGSYWTVVTLIGAGEADPSAGVCLLVVEDPRLPMIQMEDAALFIRPVPGAAPVEAEQRVRLVPGQQAMFPSWLRHRLELDAASRQNVVLTLNLTAFRPDVGDA